MEPSGKFPNLNFNKERPISKGRATFKGSFFIFWHFGIGFTLKDCQYCANSCRKAKEVNKWILMKCRKHGIIELLLILLVCMWVLLIRSKLMKPCFLSVKGGRRLVEA